MTKTKMSNFILPAIIVLSILLHVFRIPFPEKPVFDEVHFTTYAVNYARHEAYLDIHPPLGKLIYAIPLFFSNKNSYENRNFISVKRDDSTGKFVFSVYQESFGSFPYIPMRLVSAFFGILIVLFGYLLMKKLTADEATALLTAFFLAFDNALIVETRLILLNGIYLALGLISVTLFFANKPKPFFGGLVWGLALSVKLLALGFLGLLIGNLIAARENHNAELKKTIIFAATGLTVLFLVFFFLNNFFIPAEKRVNLYSSLLGKTYKVKKSPSFIPKIAPYVIAPLEELNTTVSGYIAFGSSHPSTSAWYEWPIMKKPMAYFFVPLINPPTAANITSSTASSTINRIGLVGNPFVWALAGLSIPAFLLQIRKRWQERDKRKAEWALFSAYVFSLLPFIVIVKRSTFLYHYFPALIAGICLSSIFVANHLKALSERQRKIIGASLISLVIFFFVLVSPYTYGL